MAPLRLEVCGFSIFYFRDYDPDTGRLVESDPIGLPGGINTYAYVDNTPTMEYDANGLEAVSYMMQHDGRPHPKPPPLGVTPQAKAIICKAINDCNGDMDCVFRHLNRDRKNRRYQGGIDPKKWNDPDLRGAENFATAAASNSYGMYGLPGYPWLARSERGIFEY